MRSKIAYKEIYEYSRLESAARQLCLPETEETEVRLHNLHNHLVWHSYVQGKDLVADAILSSAITELMKERNADISELPAGLVVL